MGWYSGSTYEEYMNLNRALGPYRLGYWTLIFCNVLVPQSLWFSKVRRSALVLFIVAMVIQVGMWMERFVIVITSLHRDFLPSSWGMYYPTFWDWATFAGTIGLFLCMFFVFIRILPVISIFEMRELVNEVQEDRHGGHAPVDPDELAVMTMETPGTRQGQA
jgi:molybdopterin-containing oxidoreductase family membrane subunit